MTEPHLGRQGGDLRARGPGLLDLSTCVNPYGPPEAVLVALRNMNESAVKLHPYGAATEVEELYAQYLGQPAHEFVAGSGTSDLIWSLAQYSDGQVVCLPLPCYTEYRQAFPGARTLGGGPSTHTPEVLDQAMRECRLIILSNPHNPTGQVINRRDLIHVARNNPACTLIVDESYMDFLWPADTQTLVGSDAGNIIALRSPSKFFGLAGVRSGVAWTRNPAFPRWRRQHTNWPVSAFAAEALRVAMSDEAWSADARQHLADDSAWLHDSLKSSALRCAPGSLHFRLLTGEDRAVTSFATSLESSGIIVRILGEAHGIGSAAVRISSPHLRDRQRLTDALIAVNKGGT